MAFDGIVTKTIITELNNCLINGKINKIFEPNKNEINFNIYNNKKNYLLNISIDSSNYRINLTTHSKPNPQNVLNFCMVLRKHLTSGIIKKIYSSGFERIVFIDIECINELNDKITKTLVIELMGKHSNVILLNSKSNIIDSLRHLNKFDNSNRNIFPGCIYENIVSDKLDFFKNKTFNEFYTSLNISSFNTNISLSTILSQTFTGFGKKNIFNFLDNLNILDNSISAKDLKLIYTSLKLICKSIENNTLENIKISKSKSKTDDYFICLSKEDYDYLSINFFIDDFYFTKEKQETLSSYKNNILQLILKEIHKLKDKLTYINNKIFECNNMDQYRLYGELITSNLYRIKDYPQKEITLENYYDNNNLITIKLDEKISPSKNANHFFKKYKKLQNTNNIIHKQKEIIIEELNYLDSIIYELSECTSKEDIENIYSEICDNLIYSKNANTVNNNISNLLKNKLNTKNLNKNTTNVNTINSSISKYLIDNYTVLVGKNNKQNDYITCKLANNSDIWFHTKDIHGSHVVLKIENNQNEISDSLLYKCACLAAYYSKARLSQNVPVDYTYVKYVKKPNGAKPGMVIYTNNKTLYVNPNNNF